jgi:hypothetical protein
MLRVLEPALGMKAQADSNCRGWKDFFIENLVGEKRRERLHIRECRGTWKPVIPWARVVSGFYSLVCIA